MLTGTLAFNLLMGRTWPPKSDDLTRAEAVCREYASLVDDAQEHLAVARCR